MTMKGSQDAMKPRAILDLILALGLAALLAAPAAAQDQTTATAARKARRERPRAASPRQQPRMPSAFAQFITPKGGARAMRGQGQLAYNVRAFGAAGDGRKLDSPAIDKAIAAAAEAGGGTVQLPAGAYLSGSIHLRSNINLHLDAGAVILGAPQELKAYDKAEPFEGKAYQDGGHTYFHNSLIWGEGLSGVSITGRGIIHGGGLISGDNPRDYGNKAIALKNCRDVLLRDVTILHGGHFAIITTGCDMLTVDNVMMDTNRDGIDIDCCRNVMVSNCRINSPNDDGLCPKSSYALGRAVITENMTITNCAVSGFEEGTLFDGTLKPKKGGMGRIKFGTESNGGFRNVTVSNCTFRNCRGLAIEEVDGGLLENITISNLAMMDVQHYPIYIRLGARNRGPEEKTTTGTLRNVLISDVIATGIDKMSGINITGIPGHPIEGVRLQNIRLIFSGGGEAKDAAREFPEDVRGYPEPQKVGVTPAYGLYARHARDLQLQNVSLSYLEQELRPAAAFIDVNGLEIDNLKAQAAEGVPAARFEQTRGVVVRNSPVLKGLAPEGGEGK